MWRYLILIAVYLISTTLPLALPVGMNLEYEYVLLASYAALLLLPLVGLAMPLRLLPQADGVYSPPYAFEVFWIFLLSPLIAAAPGSALLLSHTCLCSGPGFGFWMLVLWYPAWVLAHAIMHLLWRLRSKGSGRLWPGFALAAAYLLATLGAGAQLWLAPQKHLMHPLLGFWHGPIYDSYISVDHGLILARASHLALGLTLLMIAWLQWRVTQVAALVLALTLTLITAHLSADYPSSQNSKDTLDQLLPAVVQGEGFTLRYQPVAAGAAMPQDIQHVLHETAFHMDELRTALQDPGGAPLPPVTVYVYPSKDQKKLWFGAGATDVTDVHTPSIHITAETWPHPTLRHELVHALASGFGYKGIGFHPNMAFTEGLAVALAPQPGALTLDQASADLLLNKRLPPLDTLFTPAFWTVSGDRAYTVAGSLLRFILANKGTAAVKALYSGKSWEEAFGQDRASLTAAWQEHISKDYDPKVNALYTAALFSDPGLLHDLCPHSKADLQASRSSNLYTRMRQLVGWDPERDYLPYLAHLDAQDQGTKVALWRQQLNSIAAAHIPSAEALAKLHTELAAARHSPASSLADIEAAVLDADILKLQGDTSSSVALLKQLAAEGKERFFGAGLSRDIAARLTIEQDEAHINAQQALEWRRYLAGWRRTLPAPILQIHGDPWLLTYLKLRNPQTNLNGGELRRLLTEVPPDSSLPPSFAFEWYRLIAERMMQLHAFSDAELAYSKAAGVSPPATRELYEQYGRRARFYAKNGLTARN